uniref:Ion_trans domain-containing protein n=2 Tax=Mesocestoides corti TaxID=53468 RepID=A0A5K3FG89_MESCO
MATGCSEFYRVRRFLRPYFLISSSQMLKKTIKCLWNTLPELASFLLLLMLWILSSTVAAMCLFSGPLRQKSGNLSRDPSLSSKRRGLGWLYETFYNLIILLTTANHPDVILSNYNENRAASFFDIIFLAVGTYIFMNIFTAIMYNQFRGYLHSSVEKRIFRRRVAVRAAFEVLKSRDLIPVVDADKILQLLDEVQMPSWKKAVISTKLMAQYDGNPLKVNEFMDVFRLLDLAAPPRTPVLVRQFTSPIASQVQLFCLSNLYRKIELFLSIVNVVCIVLQLVAFEDAETPSFAFLMINTCFAGVYMLEIGVSVWIHGWRASLLTPVTIFDLVVSTSNLV